MSVDLGIEKGNKTERGERTRIVYDMKTLPGNSGSPVLGRGGKVKAIHVAGDETADGLLRNMGQDMSWIIPTIERQIQTFN